VRKCSGLQHVERPIRPVSYARNVLVIDEITSRAADHPDGAGAPDRC
jgi:hypothetical protein